MFMIMLMGIGDVGTTKGAGVNRRGDTENPTGSEGTIYTILM